MSRLAAIALVYAYHSIEATCIVTHHFMRHQFANIMIRIHWRSQTHKRVELSQAFHSPLFFFGFNNLSLFCVTLVNCHNVVFLHLAYIFLNWSSHLYKYVCNTSTTQLLIFFFISIKYPHPAFKYIPYIKKSKFLCSSANRLNGMHLYCRLM